MNKGCDFYGMVEDYYKQHHKKYPEEAENMRLKIYWNDGVISELTEAEATKTGESNKGKMSDGEQAKKLKKHKKRKPKRKD